MERKKLITEKEAASILGTSTATLQGWRCRQRYGLGYVKIGRLVKYDPLELDRFISSRTVAGRG